MGIIQYIFSHTHVLMGPYRSDTPTPSQTPLPTTPASTHPSIPSFKVRATEQALQCCEVRPGRSLRSLGELALQAWSLGPFLLRLFPPLLARPYRGSQNRKWLSIRLNLPVLPFLAAHNPTFRPKALPPGVCAQYSLHTDLDFVTVRLKGPLSWWEWGISKKDTQSPGFSENGN